jgi:hypothetical protein
MSYRGFQVVLDRDGWYVKSHRVSVEAQMTPFVTRRAAIDATRNSNLGGLDRALLSHALAMSSSALRLR